MPSLAVMRLGRVDLLRRLPLLLLVLLAPTVAAADPDIWTIDKEGTNVSFSWSHLGLARQTGRIVDVSGSLRFDPEAPEQGSIEVVMRVASVWTGVESLDRLVRSADFLDAARHPAITFRSTEVKRVSDRTGMVIGDLTIMGVTKPVALEVTWNFSGEHPLSAVNANYKEKHVSGFSARTQILRSDWGVKRAIPIASDELEISIEAELTKREAR